MGKCAYNYCYHSYSYQAETTIWYVVLLPALSFVKPGDSIIPHKPIVCNVF